MDPLEGQDRPPDPEGVVDEDEGEGEGKGEGEGRVGAASKSGWTFLSRHAQVLLCLAHDPNLRMREIASRLDLTERSVQRMMLDLEGEGYIKRRREGRLNRYELHPDRNLRHPLVAHREVRSLLNLLGEPPRPPSDDTRGEPTRD